MPAGRRVRGLPTVWFGGRVMAMEEKEDASEIRAALRVAAVAMRVWVKLGSVIHVPFWFGLRVWPILRR